VGGREGGREEGRRKLWRVGLLRASVDKGMRGKEEEGVTSTPHPYGGQLEHTA